MTTRSVTILSLLALAAVARADDGVAVPEKTYPLSSGGRFSIENVNGSITIAGWDRPEVSVAAVKRGSSADRIEVKVAATATAVSITTEFPSSFFGWHSSSGDVDYTIKVPRDAVIDGIEMVNGPVKLEGTTGRVNASAVNGAIEAKGLSGDVTLESVNGTVSLELLKLDQSQSVSLSSVNGAIQVRLATSVGADVEAETINGRITTDLGLNVKRGQYVGSSLSGRVGSGGGRIQAETVNGAISIDKL